MFSCVDNFFLCSFISIFFYLLLLFYLNTRWVDVERTKTLSCCYLAVYFFVIFCYSRLDMCIHTIKGVTVYIIRVCINNIFLRNEISPTHNTTQKKTANRTLSLFIFTHILFKYSFKINKITFHFLCVYVVLVVCLYLEINIIK